jgi:MAF protein
MSVFQLVLASNSPRRRSLLALSGRPFSAQPASINEDPLPGEAPARYVLRLAEGKARALESSGHAVEGTELPLNSLVLGSDTTVALGMEILGKPRDTDEALEMLGKLRARTHTVFTALAVFDPASGRMQTDLCASPVPMRDYSTNEMQAYAASGDPLDKAGAYAIQHAGFHPVEGFAGCYASVMGLPLCHLERTLRSFGWSSPVDVPSACQAELNYACPVFSAILRGETAG